MTDPDLPANDGHVPFLPTSLARDALWGSKSIERFLGCTPAFVKTMLKYPDAPVYSRAGRIFSTKTELLAWLFMEKAKSDAHSAPNVN